MTDPERRPGAAPSGSCSRPDLALWLPDWDTLDTPTQRELAAHAEACPACAPNWRLIRRADAYLETSLRSSPAEALAVCPTPDELYDLGRGPGARRLSELERVGLKAHVAACAECAALVKTLEQRPPAPLVLGDSSRSFAADADLPRLDRRRRWQIWVPLAAAAAVLAIWLWRTDEGATRARSGDVGGASIRFPSAQLVRGDAAGALLFPRERLLAGRAGLHSKLEFEVAPRERATSYRAEVERHDGAAFANSTPILKLSSALERIGAGAGAEITLPPGHYTWEAWAVVDGLDVPLGRRDFEVVRDDELVAQLEQRSRAAEPARSEAILHLLHDAGYLSDARAFARTLPASPERDEYLARRPQR
jgi:hypothetical protein